MYGQCCTSGSRSLNAWSIKSISIHHRFIIHLNILTLWHVFMQRPALMQSVRHPWPFSQARGFPFFKKSRCSMINVISGGRERSLEQFWFGLDVVYLLCFELTTETLPVHRCPLYSPRGSAEGTGAALFDRSGPGRTPSRPGTWPRRWSPPADADDCPLALCGGGGGDETLLGWVYLY